MPYTDLLRVTVCSSAARRPALAAITAVPINGSPRRLTLVRRRSPGGWSRDRRSVPRLGRPAAGRRRRPRRPRRARKTSTSCPAETAGADRARPALAARRCSRSLAGVARDLLPAGRGDRRRLRAAGRARLAQPRGGRDRRSRSATACASTSSPARPSSRSSLVRTPGLRTTGAAATRLEPADVV